jgi:hypothetical protein
MDWPTAIGSIGGNAVWLAAVAWLARELITNRLTRDVEKFKIEIRADADTEIEKIKSFLLRSARVHERQVETLLKLYRHLSDAQDFFQRLSSSVRMAGEVTDEEYQRLCREAVLNARETFSDGRLLIPTHLADLCNRFFSSLFEGQSYLGLAQHPSTAGGQQRAAFWEKAQTAAFDNVPKILAEIEKTARSVIHGEPLITQLED